MLRPDAIRAVGPVDPVSRVDRVADPRQEAFERSMSGLLGKSIMASVLARLTDGTSLVSVQGTQVRMMLPPSVKAGAEVPLTLISAGPRPTFQLTSGDGQAIAATTYPPSSLPAAAASAQAAARMSQLGAPPGQQRPAEVDDAAGEIEGTIDAELNAKGQTKAGQGAPAAPLAQTGATGQSTVLNGAPVAADPNAPPAPVLSATGKVISSVLSAAQNAPGAALALAGAEPLVATARPDPAQLSVRLQETISRSGLFYESHVAEWAEGTRTLAALMQEPQAQRAPGVPTDPNTAQFINLQLTSQEQSRVMWQGQLAPGQHMEWEIEKDAPERRDGDGRDGEDEQPVWRSGMRFRMPLLGEIDATVVMVGGQCQIEIRTVSDEVGGLLRRHAGALNTAMEAAGTPLTSLSIGPAAGPAATKDGDG